MSHKLTFLVGKTAKKCYKMILKTEWSMEGLGHFMVKRETGENERVCALIKPRVPLRTKSVYLSLNE